MGTKIVIFLGLGSIFFTWVILFVIFISDPEVPQIESGSLEEVLVQDVPKQSITTWEGSFLSAAPIINHADTEPITNDGLFENSASENSYSILYDEPSGNVTVLLLSEPLGLSRSLAEQQLRTVFPEAGDDLCDMRIRVYVNEAVNRAYATGDLGLSFCEYSTVLP